MATARTAKSALLRSLDQSNQPIFVLDDKRKIIYLNHACCVWTGFSLEELTEIECRYHSSPEIEGAELIAAMFCPSDSVFAGEATENTITIRQADGRVSTRKVLFCPLQNDSKVAAVIGIIASVDTVESGDRKNEPLPSVESIHALLQKDRAKKYQSANISKWVGNGTYSRQLQIKIESAIRAKANTLIAGPRGVGKEHLANIIHQKCDATDTSSKILAIDCALADQELIQDTVRYLGRFGTVGSNRVLLKRVELLSEAAQQELLGFLEMPAFELSMIATSEVLEIKNELDEKLVQFLEGIRIDLPSLAERMDDIPYFAQQFVEQQNSIGQKQCYGFESDALDALMLHDWPGNLNELSNVVRHAFENSKSTRIQLNDLPRSIHVAIDAHATPTKNNKNVDLDDELYQLEKRLIEEAMKSAKGNKAKAARMLGINRARLLRRVEFFEEGKSTKTNGSTDDD